jgi:hypothetical protein
MSNHNSLERAAIETLVAATIGTACPLFFENTLDTDDNRNVVWARFKLQPVLTRYASVGSAPDTRMRRTQGFLNLQIFVPENQGIDNPSNSGLAIADLYQSGVDSVQLDLPGGVGYVRMGVTNVLHEIERSRAPNVETGSTMLLCVTDYFRDVFG